eukprot:150629_1
MFTNKYKPTINTNQSNPNFILYSTTDLAYDATEDPTTDTTNDLQNNATKSKYLKSKYLKYQNIMQQNIIKSKIIQCNQINNATKFKFNETSSEFMKIKMYYNKLKYNATKNQTILQSKSKIRLQCNKKSDYIAIKIKNQTTMQQKIR